MREVMLDVALQPVKQVGVAPDLQASLRQRQVAGGMIRQRCSTKAGRRRHGAPLLVFAQRIGTFPDVKQVICVD